MKKKFLLGAVTLLVTASLLVSCNSQDKKNDEANNTTPNVTTDKKDNEAKDTTSDVAMQYISKEDLKKSIDDGNKDYVVLDVRKKEDYDKEHIKNSLSADVDETKEDASKTENSTANLKAALKEATESETGKEDTKVALLCYSGKRYAQAATNILVDMGIKKENIYTLDGGYKGWTGDEFTSLLEKGN